VVGAVDQPDLFQIPVDEKLIHRYFVWVRSMLRTTLGHTKTRGEVSGGGKKPWKQKGTGRARVGSSRTPVWRHGGIVFGPNNDRNWATRMPRGERRKALFSVFSSKALREQVLVLEDWQITTPKTRDVVTLLTKLPIAAGQKVLHVHPAFDENIFHSTSNLPGITSKTVQSMNVIDLLNNDILLVTKEGLQALEHHFTPEEV